MAGYDPSTIEPKWQQFWQDNSTFHTPNPDDPYFQDRPKFYVLDMFPYPSGAGLHVGHPEGYTATDIVARYKRMTGHNVLHPMGYDAFGLPAEQYAVDHGVHPRETTEQNIANIERQIKMFGFSYDWSRRIATTDVEYYRWTQWIFLRIFHSWYDPAANAARPIRELIDKLEAGEYLVDLTGHLVLPALGEQVSPELFGMDSTHRKFAELTDEEKRNVIDSHRLAYRAEVPVNWCPALGTVLANEEVTNDGRSERGNHPVYRRALNQWMLRITAYAERLLADLEPLDWPEPIKIMQRNWVGKSTGASVVFALADDSGESIEVYTTRPDTLFGATYMVLAPEHPLVETITTEAQRQAVDDYVAAAKNKSELERTAEAKQKTGVFTGAHAINPVNDEPVPVWVADYVVMGYGTGAIMAVPAHDDRDFEFAQTFNLPIRPILKRRDEAAPRYVGGLSGPDFEKVYDIWRADPKKFPEVRGLYFGGFWDQCTGGSSLYQPEKLALEWIEKGPELPKGFIVVGTDGMNNLLQAAGFKSDTPPFPLCVTDLADDLELVDSGPIAGLSPDEGKRKITEWLEAQGLGKAAVNYKLRDWLFSRQRYWGEPFPIVHCEDCGTVALREDQLPLTLPPMDDFTPAASDEPDAPPQPPLGKASDWIHAPCPRCGKEATRELNTMPQWAGSCWYYLRYLDPANDEQFVCPEVEGYWMGDVSNPHSEIQDPKSGGVDLYVGGAEHAVLHLLYARFWHKVLYDLGYVSTPEPFHKLFNQGMILSFAYKDSRGITVGPDEVELREDEGEDVAHHKKTGEKLEKVVAKMSKSLKNVVNPDEVIEQYGADTFRLYEMFMGPLDAAKPWNTRDVPGLFRFCQRIWRMVVGDEDNGVQPLLTGDDHADEAVEKELHRLVKKVGEDVEAMKFNTAIAAMMEFVNTCFKIGRLTPSQAERFTLVLAPFAPHLAEELWQYLGHDDTLAYAAWPEYDEMLITETTIELPVQVNGKVRGRVEVPVDAEQNVIIEQALAESNVAAHVEGKTLVKKIVVPGRLVNLVVQ